MTEFERKLTIDNLRKLAKKHGGECLSNEYVETYSYYLWKCKHGHVFKSRYYNIYSGKWCRECSDAKLRLSEDDIIKIFSDRNMRIVSGLKDYKNSRTKLGAKCNICGYIWETNIDRVKKSKKCPKCVRVEAGTRMRNSKERIQKICTDARCMLLDLNGYRGHEDEILVKCLKCEFVFKRSVVSIKRHGSQCKNCYKIKNKIASALRNRINHAIKGGFKSGSAVSDLGCSISDLKIYLESKFYPNPINGEQMTWDNWSMCGWHIDHIKPLASFDLTDRGQFLRACHYTNLQPLWAEENLKKGAKIL